MVSGDEGDQAGVCRFDLEDLEAVDSVVPYFHPVALKQKNSNTKYQDNSIL